MARLALVVGRVGVAAASLAAAVGVLAAPGAARPAGPARPAAPRAAGASCTETPFTAGFDAEVRRRWPGKDITAAVYDTRTGCQYRYRSALRITTASVLKIAIMGAVQLRAQQEGRSLTSRERSLIGPMIRTSDDPSANALWSSVGGVSGMAAFDRATGLADTREASPWGLTSTSAADRNELLRQLVLGQFGPFSASTRAQARAFLLDVAPSQRWGITAGVPSGWKVPLKNGFFPSSCCGWRINTSGVVERPGGGAYVATVLSDGWANQAAGVPAVELVSKVIASWMLTSIGPHRSPARFAHQASRDVLGRTPTFAQEQASAWRVGADASRAPAELVRSLGDPALDATSGQVLRLYLGVLGRLPEASTWSGRVAQLRSKERSVAQVADAIAWSSELSGGAPLTTAAFVDLAYRRVYGRSPSSADLAYWTGRIDRGHRRGELLVGLISSNTFRWASGRRVQVATSYLTLLRRSPSAEALGSWAARLDEGTPLAELVSQLFSSTTYRMRFS